MTLKDKDKKEEEFCFYVSGFVDGEGCFSISFRMLSRIKIKFETRASFSVAQKRTAANYALLDRIRLLFKGGGIRGDRNCYKYETRALSHLMTEIIPFFKKYPLYTSKALDFNNFCKICSLIAAKQHLNKIGLLQILDLAENMKFSGTRKLDLNGIRAQLKKII